MIQEREAEAKNRQKARSSVSNKRSSKGKESVTSYSKQEAIQEQLKRKTAFGEERPTKEYLRKSIAMTFNKQPEVLKSSQDSSSTQWKETLEMMEREKRLRVDPDELAAMERLENDSREEMGQDFNVKLDIQAYQLQDEED